ncbi:MAG TPA: undecaprenyl-diphosphatase UppP [Vicinamibacterales bacterium]|nr:undecaprenyl-diphosphatase UppP [Vicinamibacterales bacterium]
MGIGAAVLLGIVQGVTEFLPISSSAHLILAREFFGWDAGRFGLPFDVACHVGTLLAVVVFFRKDIIELIRAAPAALGRHPGPAGRRVRLIVAGTIPVAIVGLLFADAIETHLRGPLVAAAGLVIGAVLLLVVERIGPRTKTDESLTIPGAVAIGIGQASALMPGMSRSGTTIAVGMALGLRRDAAARFTFLMSVPAITAAALKEAAALRTMPPDGPMLGLMAVGLVTSAVVGYLTVKYFLRFLAAHRLDVFAWYRLALAAVTVAWVMWIG